MSYVRLVWLINFQAELDLVKTMEDDGLGLAFHHFAGFCQQLEML